MTTIIRNGNQVYADSCVTMSSGSMPSTRYSAVKLMVHHSKKCVIGIAGRVLDEPDIYDVINKSIDKLIEQMNDVSTLNINQHTHDITNYIQQMTRDAGPKDYVPDYGGMNVFILFKDYTVLYQLKEHKCVGAIYHGNTVLCVGSGGAFFTGLVGLDMDIEEKLKAVYSTDTHSGGNVLRVDLNKLEKL